MNRLCFGTFAKTIQEALQKPNSNQAVAEMLLGLVAAKGLNEPFTMLPKKVTALFSYKEDVQEDIASMASVYKVIESTPETLKSKIIPFLKPAHIEDLKENLRKIIKNDRSISPNKRNELLMLSEKENDYLSEFLSVAYLYALGRSNKGNQLEIEGVQTGTPTTLTQSMVFDIIRENSTTHYNEYKRVNGIAVEPDILPSVETSSGSISLKSVIDKETDSVILVRGDGGIGKSYIIFDCCDGLLKSGVLLPLYVPMKNLIRTDESPILQYVFDKYLLRLDLKRDANSLKQSLRDIVTSADTQLIFFLDGFNEYAFAAEENESNVVIEEIRWLQDTTNMKVVIASRSNKGFETAYTVQVRPLDEQRVLDYLKAHDNTNRLDFSALANKRVLELLQTPLMLALFTKTYSPVYTELNNVNIENVEKHSDILMLCVEYQKNRLRKTSKANYALDILLPLITLGTDMKMSFDVLDLAEQAKLELQTTFTDNYRRMWLRKTNEYNQDDFKVFISDEIAIFKTLISETILENAVFLVEHGDTISWQHELLMDWFAARGLVLTLEYQRDYAVGKLAEISEYITKFDAKSDGLIPVALFLVEMLEDKPIADSVEFILLLSALARSFHDAKDSRYIYKFALSTLSKMDAGHMDTYPQWQFADLMNHVAYTLLSVYKDNMDEDFDYSACIEYAKEHLDKALTIIKGVIDKDTYLDAKLAEAQIYGNLGAYSLAKNKVSNEKEWVRKALEYHQKGLEARQIVFGNSPESKEGCGFIGTSYNCLATDYFMLGDYGLSYENHKKAILFREMSGAKDIRKVESYTRCIGTLSKMLINGCADEQHYLEEALVLLKKALMLESEQPQLISLDCLLRNRYELNNLKNGCGSIIGYMNKHRDSLDENSVATIKTVATKIDALCDELSIESNLHKQIL